MRCIFQYGVLLLLLSACNTMVKSPETIKKDDVEVRIVAVGDLFMGGTSQPVLHKKGYDYPFEATKKIIQAADVAMANLEAPLTLRGKPVVKKKYVFRTPPSLIAAALKKTGFDVMTLANNHILDYGMVGLKDTQQALKKHGIASIGAGQSLADARQAFIFEKQGFKVGFLAYSLTFPEAFWANDKHGGTAFAYEQDIRQDMKNLKKQVDSIVVSFHWGREGQTELRPYQQKMGYMVIDEGASLVIGHHPHIMQGIERYKSGLILYSLGNYVFGSYSNHVQFGGLAAVTLTAKGVKDLSLTLLDVNNFRRHFQPIPLEGAALDKAFLTVKALSLERDTTILLRNQQLVLEEAMQ